MEELVGVSFEQTNEAVAVQDVKDAWIGLRAA